MIFGTFSRPLIANQYGSVLIRLSSSRQNSFLQIMEESVRELKEDLKNARNLIACLSETIERLSKTEKQGKDEGLHTKMDKILEKLEKQDELKGDFDTLKHKVDNLTDSVKNIAHEVTNSAKIGRILDTVETSVGYSELFVKDFEGIYLKMRESEATMNRFEKKLDHMDENSQNLNRLIENICKSDAKLQEKAEQISLRLTEILQKTEHSDLALKENSADIGEFAEEIKKSITNITEYFGITPDPIFRCCNRECNRMLPNNLPLREDGVSIMCYNCSRKNIIGTLKKGHKWMCMDECNQFHFNQFSLMKSNVEKVKCPTCGKEGKLKNGNRNIAIRIDFKHIVRATENKLREIETSLALLSDPPLTCWNCKCVLPKNLLIREDGISVKCPKCDLAGIDIVGKLRENHKWMMLSCDHGNHYQQFPSKIQNLTKEECQICGKTSTVMDANWHVARSANKGS